jgi:glutamyl-tRNA synthetase
VHLPVILKEQGGGKMSKRDPGSTLREYIEAGYEPEAVVNWLTNIGWSFGDDREIFTVQESIERFSLERINPTASKLPRSKLDDINGHYIREMLPEKIAEKARPLLEAEYGPIDSDKLAAILPHVQVRINPLKQIVDLTRFLFVEKIDAPSAEQLIPKKMDAAETVIALERSRDTLANLPDFQPETQEAAMRALAEELELKVGQLLNPVRWAVTGQQVSPPIFESMAALGRDVSLARIEAAIGILRG